MHRHIAFALLTASLCAQAPSPWADLAVPNGVVQSGVFNLGKMTHYLANGRVYVFSAFTRRWTSMPVGPSASTLQTNDWLLVRDGATWFAFAAMRGVFEPLPVTAPVLVNPVSQNNDSALFVLSGGMLHAFSGFVGQWSSRPITANASIAVQRHNGLLADGTLLSGYDSFSGQWHDLTVPAQATGLSCDGTAGTAVVGTTVYGFSALRGNWSTAPGFANATFTRSDDWAVYRDGVQALGFSGLRGAFATTTLGPVQSTQTQDLFGAFVTSAGTAQFFSAVTGTWSIAGISSAAIVRTASALALILDAPQITAWSAVRGSFAPIIALSSGEDLAGSVAAVVPAGGGAPLCYSAIQAAWQQAPSDALPGLPRVTTTSALISTNTGFRAFSARTGAFVPLTTTNGQAEGSTAVAPALVWDSSAFHFFDARADAWITEPRLSAATPGITLWRTSALILDGSDAIGFGTQSGTVARVTLPEPPISWRANSEALGITTANHLVSFSALPLNTSLSQFPDFRRAFVAGADFRLYLRLGANDVAFLGLGMPAANPTTLPGLGLLRLDPTYTGVTFVQPEATAERAPFRLTVPDAPVLRGTQFWLQSLVLPAAGTPYLTDAATILVN